jgi:hypothetical protein
MIRGQGIDARFDIGEVLLPKSTHVREESFVTLPRNDGHL